MLQVTISSDNDMIYIFDQYQNGCWHISGVLLQSLTRAGAMQNICYLFIFLNTSFHYSLNLFFLKKYCSTQLVNLRTWLVLVLWENINVFPVLPTSPLVSMATWQGVKDKLLALKFLTALMKMLQEVHSKLYSYRSPVPKTAVIQGLSDAVGML